MLKLKNPFALNDNNEIIYINHANKYSNYYCPTCGDKLITKMGEKNTWHFAHNTSSNCNGDPETTLHMYAKELIKKSTIVFLPNLNNYEYFEIINKNVADEMKSQEIILNNGFPYELFFKGGCFNYKWIANEITINDFKPDSLIEIQRKRVAIEIYVTHEVDKLKQEKVKNMKLDMLQIELDEIEELIQNKEFDLDRYILYDAPRKWIYKSNVGHREEEAIEKMQEIKLMLEEEKARKINEQKLLAKKKEYVISHEKVIEIKNIIKLKEVLLNYEKIQQSNEISLYNLPVRGEYAFQSPRCIWQKSIFDIFIRDRENKTIQLAKINSWVEKYSRLEYYKEFDYDKSKIWHSKYSAIKNYLYELDEMFAIDIYTRDITHWREIDITNSKIDKSRIAELRKKADKRRKYNICSSCGEIYDLNDNNCFYIRNFGMDRLCFFEVLEKRIAYLKNS